MPRPSAFSFLLCFFSASKITAPCNVSENQSSSGSIMTRRRHSFFCLYFIEFKGGDFGFTKAVNCLEGFKKCTVAAAWLKNILWRYFLYPASYKGRQIRWRVIAPSEFLSGFVFHKVHCLPAFFVLPVSAALKYELAWSINQSLSVTPFAARALCNVRFNDGSSSMTTRPDCPLAMPLTYVMLHR